MHPNTYFKLYNKKFFKNDTHNIIMSNNFYNEIEEYIETFNKKNNFINS